MAVGSWSCSFKLTPVSGLPFRPFGPPIGLHPVCGPRARALGSSAERAWPLGRGQLARPHLRGVSKVPGRGGSSRKTGARLRKPQSGGGSPAPPGRGSVREARAHARDQSGGSRWHEADGPAPVPDVRWSLAGDKVETRACGGGGRAWSTPTRGAEVSPRLRASKGAAHRRGQASFAFRGRTNGDGCGATSCTGEVRLPRWPWRSGCPCCSRFPCCARGGRRAGGLAARGRDGRARLASVGGDCCPAHISPGARDVRGGRDGEVGAGRRARRAGPGSIPWLVRRRRLKRSQRDPRSGECSVEHRTGGSVSRAAGAAALDIGVQPAGRRCGHGERGTAGREGQVSGGRPGGILDEMHAGPGCVWR